MLVGVLLFEEHVTEDQCLASLARLYLSRRRT
jgi:hypothetical protein